MRFYTVIFWLSFTVFFAAIFGGYTGMVVSNTAILLCLGSFSLAMAARYQHEVVPFVMSIVGFWAISSAAFAGDAATEQAINTMAVVWVQLPTWLQVLVQIVPVIHLLASAYVAITPTPKDDAVYSKIYQFIIEPLALVIGKAKDRR